MAGGDNSPRNSRKIAKAGALRSSATMRAACMVVTPLRGLSFQHAIRGFLADSSPTAIVVLALHARLITL